MGAANVNDDDEKWILVIEDEVDLLEVVAENIQLFGFNVMGVQNAKMALEKIENQKFSAILVDLNLGDESAPGNQIIERIHKSISGSLNRDTPIILCSGNIDQEVVAELKGKVHDAVTKPIDLNSLIEKLNRWANHPPKNN